jgi:ankyrin repeat protein
MVNFLLSKGANINTKNSLGNTPLLCAVFQGHAEVVRVLLSHGASVDAANQFKNTPLTWTAIRGHFGIARLLVGYGADVNLFGLQFPLHVSVIP